MIEEIKTKSIFPNWNKEIKLKLNLRDLQIIYDAIGELPPNILKNKHKDSDFLDTTVSVDNTKVIAPIDDTIAAVLIDEIYSALEIILDKYNGIID